MHSQNHFKTALNDPEVKEMYEGKPFHMAALSALAAYVEKGKQLSDLPWFRLSGQCAIKKAA